MVKNFNVGRNNHNQNNYANKNQTYFEEPSGYYKKEGFKNKGVNNQHPIMTDGVKSTNVLELFILEYFFN